MFLVLGLLSAILRTRTVPAQQFATWVVVWASAILSPLLSNRLLIEIHNEATNGNSRRVEVISPITFAATSTTQPSDLQAA